MKLDKGNVLRIIFALTGVVCVILSLMHDGEHNWFLPIGLLSVSVANIIYIKENGNNK